MSILDSLKAKAKADKKTIVLPESMDKRTFEAAEKILKEGLANLIIIGTPEEIAETARALTFLVQLLLTHLMTLTSRSILTSSLN